MSTHADMEHRAPSPETLNDEACVLTFDEWYAIEDIVGWARAGYLASARAAERSDLPSIAGAEYEDAARAAAALAILRGAKERTFRSHFPEAYAADLWCSVVQDATVTT